MRLDLYLCASGLCRSRTEAKGFISEGAVKVGGKVITKPAYDIPEEQTAQVELDRSTKKYVSRGGYKLEAALVEFGIDVRGKMAIDIGASSGGFTDCLLQNGVDHVLAVDAGHSQLVASIAEDDRVSSYEKFNARYMRADMLEYAPNLAVMDVSFISSTLILPAVYDVLAPGGEFVLLIKPQFEVGPSNIDKGGVVKSERAREAALSKVIDFAVALGFRHEGHIVSPIKGGDGNIEYLACFKKTAD